MTDMSALKKRPTALQWADRLEDSGWLLIVLALVSGGLLYWQATPTHAAVIARLGSTMLCAGPLLIAGAVLYAAGGIVSAMVAPSGGPQRAPSDDAA